MSRRRLIRGSLATGGAILLYEKPTITCLGPIAALAISGGTPVLGPVPPPATAPPQERPGRLPSSGEAAIDGPAASVAAGLGLIAAGVGVWLRDRLKRYRERRRRPATGGTETTDA